MLEQLAQLLLTLMIAHCLIVVGGICALHHNPFSFKRNVVEETKPTHARPSIGRNNLIVAESVFFTATPPPQASPSAERAKLIGTIFWLYLLAESLRSSNVSIVWSGLDVLKGDAPEIHPIQSSRGWLYCRSRSLVLDNHLQHAIIKNPSSEFDETAFSSTRWMSILLMQGSGTSWNVNPHPLRPPKTIEPSPIGVSWFYEDIAL
jgi:hypothetical protein